MKARELRELTREELLVKERELAEELFRARLKFQAGELENTAKLCHDRRDLARIKTLLREKAK